MSVFGGGAGAGAAAAEHALRTVQAAIAIAPPQAKRARNLPELVSYKEDDVESKEVECPKEMEPADFEKLRALITKHRDDPFLRVLPMPTAAYDAFGIPKPEAASLMDTALACFNKQAKEVYSTHEVEVRDLRATLTEKDFPEFYTGPAHAHMLPDGGIRVITHTAMEDGPAAAATTTAALEASVTAAASSSSSAIYRGGAGAGAGMTMSDD